MKGIRGGFGFRVYIVLVLGVEVTLNPTNPKVMLFFRLFFFRRVVQHRGPDVIAIIPYSHSYWVGGPPKGWV